MPSATSEKAAGLALALLSACAVGPDFQRPPPPAALAYLPAEAHAENEQRIVLGRKIPAQWWALFHNDRLDETVREAIAKSPSLVAAKATLSQAQEAVVQAGAGFYPQVDLTTGARRGSAGNLFSVGGTASYAIDLFGGMRRRVEQQSALLENERYQLATAYLALTGNCVVEALAIASARLEIRTAEELIQNDQKDLDLVQREFDAGKVARTDVLTAAAELATDRTLVPPLRQQLNVARHALAVLSGRAPAEANLPDFELEEFRLPEELPMSFPSEFVRQRPDILAVEALLHADSAAIGVATADLFPSITLSASLLQSATSLANLLGSAARSWSAGGNADAPLFHGGALQSQRRAAVDAYEARLATYRQTVLEAFGQVADSLSALEHDAEMVTLSRRAVDIAQASLAVQRSTYAAGKTSVLQLITAENTYANARLGLARTLGARLTDTAQLFVAVGGGWWNAEIP